MTQQPWRDADLLAFEGRLIHDLRPPITAAQIEAIESRLTGPIPPDLLRLWSQSFGGAVDYDLPVRIGGAYHRASLVELFYIGSDHYRDLMGWIDAEVQGYEEALEAYQEELEEYEEELEEEGEDAGPPPEAPFAFDGRIPILPFGGFEYLDRLYISVDAASGFPVGAILLYMRGLPPAWSMRLHNDSVACIAEDLPALFRKLVLLHDARTCDPELYPRGDTIWPKIQALIEADPTRGREVEDFFFSARLSWREALESGRIADSDLAQREALLHVARTGDLEALSALVKAGVDPSQELDGRGSLLDFALLYNQLEVARWAVEQGMPATRGLVNARGPLTVPLTEALLSAGAIITPDSVRNAIANDCVDVARTLTWAAESTAEIRSALVERTGKARDDADARRTGRLSSSRSAEDYEAEAERLEDFIAWMDTLA